jgi:hypothetical protein
MYVHTAGFTNNTTYSVVVCGAAAERSYKAMGAVATRFAADDEYRGGVAFLSNDYVYH